MFNIILNSCGSFGKDSNYRINFNWKIKNIAVLTTIIQHGYWLRLFPTVTSTLHIIFLIQNDYELNNMMQ